jgi:GntR family transcriptional regulator
MEAEEPPESSRKDALRQLRARSTRRGQSSAWVYDTVRAGFRDGYYASDHVFSEYELMQFFNVTRASVRQALERLVEEGILTRAPKRGTLPKGDAVHVTPEDDVSSHLFGASIPGRHSEQLVSSELVNASVFVASRLGVKEGTEVRVDDSIASVGGAPFASNVMYSKVGQLPERGMTGDGSFPLRVEALGFEIDRIESTFEAISADVETARKLGVPESAPLLLRTLTLFAPDDSRLLAIIRMRGDRAIVHTHR